MSPRVLTQATAAIGDPGAVVTRDQGEPLPSWQARAALLVLERAGVFDPPTPLPAFAGIAALMLVLGLAFGRWVL